MAPRIATWCPSPIAGACRSIRKGDNSWPTRVEYKDFVKLPDLRMEAEPELAHRAGPGNRVLARSDGQCDIPPGPNDDISKPKRFKVLAPKPPEQKKIDEQNRKLDNQQKAHEKKQEDRNKTENRDVKQDPPKGAENQPKEGTRDRKARRGRCRATRTPTPTSATTRRKRRPDHEQQSEQVRNAIKKSGGWQGRRHEARRAAGSECEGGAIRNPATAEARSDGDAAVRNTVRRRSPTEHGPHGQ